MELVFHVPLIKANVQLLFVVMAILILERHTVHAHKMYQILQVHDTPVQLITLTTVCVRKKLS